MKIRHIVKFPFYLLYIKYLFILYKLSHLLYKAIFQDSILTILVITY